MRIENQCPQGRSVIATWRRHLVDDGFEHRFHIRALFR